MSSNSTPQNLKKIFLLCYTHTHAHSVHIRAHTSAGSVPTILLQMVPSVLSLSTVLPAQAGSGSLGHFRFEFGDWGLYPELQ